MPLPVERDADRVGARLTDWLAERIPDAADIALSDVSFPDDTGFSHETMMLDATWTVQGVRQQRGLVVRMLVPQHAVFPEQDLATEYHVMEALVPTEVAVPHPYGFESNPAVLGVPFYVVERVAGRIPSDRPPYTFEGWLKDAGPEEQERIWWSGVEAMAAIHRVDHRAFDLEMLERRGVGIGHQIDELRRYHEWVLEGRDHAVLDPAMTWLAEHRPSEGTDPGLCWGDSRLANLIYDGTEVAAVLDWEMAMIADPGMDLAWWIFFDRVFSEGLGMPRLPGLPSHADTITRWERLTGRSAHHNAYFTVFAGTRFALILIRLSQLLARAGEEPLGPDPERDNFALTFLRTVLEEAA